MICVASVSFGQALFSPSFIIILPDDATVNRIIASPHSLTPSITRLHHTGRKHPQAREGRRGASAPPVCSPRKAMRRGKRLPYSFLLLLGLIPTIILLQLDVALATTTMMPVTAPWRRHLVTVAAFHSPLFLPATTVRIRRTVPSAKTALSSSSTYSYSSSSPFSSSSSRLSWSSIPATLSLSPSSASSINPRKRTRLQVSWADAVAPHVDDTIFALSSGQGRAGVAVIRISGPRAEQCLAALIYSPAVKSPASLPMPRVAGLRKLYCPKTHEVLDQALVLWFPGPRSFTGEDTVELHCHGSRAVIQGVTQALLTLDVGKGAEVRPAERGEFTERAFGNGRMDLTEVEGLADLISADTAAQRKQALRQMGGGLRVTYEGWREELKVCLAHTEAVIDFGDDELDVDEAAYDAIRPRAATLRDEMRRHLADGNRGEVIRSGIRVAIVGPPNAGKSTLLNLLARRPAAIVSPIAGTTRDVVEVQLELAGLPVLVSDTAGIREAAADEVEQEGIRRAREAAEQAQLTLVVLDASGSLESEALASLAGVGPFAAHFPPRALNEVLAAVEEEEGLLLVVNKRDAVAEGSDLAVRLLGGAGGVGNVVRSRRRPSAFFVSCSTGEGVEEMLGGLQARLEALLDRGGGEEERNEVPVITRARHRVHVEKCLEALTAFLDDRSLGLDVAAEELRIASTELGRITGAVDVEEVLDVIFRDFCIGK